MCWFLSCQSVGVRCGWKRRIVTFAVNRNFLFSFEMTSKLAGRAISRWLETLYYSPFTMLFSQEHLICRRVCTLSEWVSKLLQKSFQFWLVWLRTLNAGQNLAYIASMVPIVK